MQDAAVLQLWQDLHPSLLPLAARRLLHNRQTDKKIMIINFLNTYNFNNNQNISMEFWNKEDEASLI